LAGNALARFSKRSAREAVVLVRTKSSDQDHDAVALVRTQHAEIDRQLAALAAMPVTGDRAGLVAEVGDLIAVHLSIEERLLAPSLAPWVSGALDAAPAADRIRGVLGDLLESDVEEEAFVVEVRDLRARLLRHADVEERQLLRHLRGLVPASRLRRLAYEMRVLEFQLRVDAPPRTSLLRAAIPEATA
jgi:hypothetical protein